MSSQTLSIDQAIDQAMAHQAGGRLADAERLYRSVLAAQPRHPEANHNLGVLLLELNRLPEALRHLKAALEAEPRDGQLWISYIDALIHAARYADARALLDVAEQRGMPKELVRPLRRRIDTLEPDPFLATEPSDWIGDTSTRRHCSDAPSERERDEITALVNAGRFCEAEELLRALTAGCPDDAWGWKRLAIVLRLQGHFDAALQAARTAVQLAPDQADHHFELGRAFDRLGHRAEAEASLRRAVQIDPTLAEAHNELALVLDRSNRLEEAETAYRRALVLRPDWPGVLSNLATVLQVQGRLGEAETLLRRAISIDPTQPAAHVNLAVILKDSNRLGEAEAHLRSVLGRFPDMLEAHSALLFLLNYSAAHSPHQCLDEARRYGRAARNKAQPFAAWTHSSQPSRLRIGIVSGDIHEHPVGFFLESALANLDTSRVEVIGFPTNPRTDALTQRLQPHLAAWQPLDGYTDEQAAKTIHEAGVHVLLELSGHSVNNRLPVLAWKPAPIQASWLGYFATTGVPGIDYILVDETCVPREHHGHFTESVWYLPDSRLCFTPPRHSAPVTGLPAIGNGYITLGSFQNLAKINDRTLALWSRVFAAIPQAKLRVQNRQMSGEAQRADLTARLTAAGIGPERVSLHGPVLRQDYLAAHGHVDFILDTSPFPGGTTTCEALWMGVPTLTLAGDRLIALQGASLLAAAGLPEWIAVDEDDFVAKAVAFAGNTKALSQLRAGLRSRLRQTPLFDAHRFAAALESALWQMWQRWNERHAVR